MTDERYAPDQIVVANAHVRVVMQKIADLGIGAAENERSRELGLTLIDLDTRDVTREAAELRQGAPDVLAGGPTPDLSVVLGEMYRRFATDYIGWVPTMGTNRLVIGPAHNINGGGGPVLPKIAMGGLDLREPDPGAGVRIGLADTALYRHPWLDDACVVAPAQRWVGAAGQRFSIASGHCTFVAGLILQKAPGATLVVEQILDASGHGESWAVAKRLVRLARAGITVLNLSIECRTLDNQAPLVLETAMNRLGSDIQVVAAAGNHAAQADARRPVWPAAFDEVLAVTARAGDAMPEWTTPPDLPWVDCVARGADVVSTYPPLGLSTVDEGVAAFDSAADNAFASWSGTSFAAGLVTGRIAAEIGRTGESARAVTARMLSEADQIAGLPCLD
jgi:membrane-anchored mycosin MYCP